MAGEMTFWEHLDELRKVIFRSFAVLIVLMVAFFLCKEMVFDGVVLAPPGGYRGPAVSDLSGVALREAGPV